MHGETLKLFSQVERGTHAKGVREYGAHEDIWTYKGGGNGSGVDEWLYDLYS